MDQQDLLDHQVLLVQEDQEGLLEVKQDRLDPLDHLEILAHGAHEERQGHLERLVRNVLCMTYS
jgi:hypothetical protein